MNSNFIELRKDIRKKVSTHFQFCVNEYGRALVAENMIDASSSESIEEAISYWCDRLHESGATPSRIEKATQDIKKDMRFSKYPPRLREFVDLCKLKPEDLKLPDIEEAFLIATGAKSIDKIPPALNYAIQETGFWDLQKAELGTNSTELRKRFEKNYLKAVELSISGKLTTVETKLINNSVIHGKPIDSSNEGEKKVALSLLDDILNKI